MKVLIFGNGWLGNKFHNYFEGSDITSTNITDFEAVKKEIQKHKPDWVMNCAGKTGRPHIDWCEEHKSETYASNVVGPFVLARACEEIKVPMAHLGSGCIYEGDNNGKGFSEEDAPNFYGSFYSRTKIWAQDILKEFPAVLQLRIRMPIDMVPGERNFISKITKYKRVISEKNSMTTLTPDFFNAVKTLMERKRTGIYNMTFPGIIEHKEILDLYKEVVDPGFNYTLYSLEELHAETKAKRSNCILDTTKLMKEVKLPHIKEAVKQCLEEYKKHLVTA